VYFVCFSGLTKQQLRKKELDDPKWRRFMHGNTFSYNFMILYTTAFFQGMNYRIRKLLGYEE
jgi:hypothetical protein